MIRVLQKSDIIGLNNLKPNDWDFDYEEFIINYRKHAFYKAFVMLEGNRIIGTGNVFLSGKIAWLANIIIQKEYRGKGYGTEMTDFLIKFLQDYGCETQLLIATELGEPVYKKLGFNKISEYVCFDISITDKFKLSPEIRKLTKSDIEQVSKMDLEANDENRIHLIHKYYHSGIGYFDTNSTLLGVYLPDFGRGLILAQNNNVGLHLLKIKHSTVGQRTLIPIENQVGIDFLSKYGHPSKVTANRMILGHKNNWNPSIIYSYGGGYCG